MVSARRECSQHEMRRDEGSRHDPLDPRRPAGQRFFHRPAGRSLFFERSQPMISRRRTVIRLRDGTIRDLNPNELVPDGAAVIVPLILMDEETVINDRKLAE